MDLFSEHYRLKKPLPKSYQDVLEELLEADFFLDDVLDGLCDPLELFENSPTLVGMAIDAIVDELNASIRRPTDYVDSHGDFGLKVSVYEFVSEFLIDLRKYYEEVT
jgi:hypothetical protein